jgi:hypothetical protein
MEDKFPKLKEITKIMELALWKMRMNKYRHQIKNENDESIEKTVPHYLWS